MSKVHQSACPLNCWDSCGFLVTVEDGKVTKVDGIQTIRLRRAKSAAAAECLRQKQIRLIGFAIR